MGQNNIPKIKTEPLLESISIGNRVVLWLTTKLIYFGTKVLPFDSIRTHYALSIDLEVWIGTASTNVVRENEARSGGVILGCKVLERRFEFLDEIGLTSRWCTLRSRIYLLRNSRVRDQNEETHSAGRHLYPMSLARQVSFWYPDRRTPQPDHRLRCRGYVDEPERRLLDQVEALLHSRCVSECFALSAHKIDILW